MLGERVPPDAAPLRRVLLALLLAAGTTLAGCGKNLAEDTSASQHNLKLIGIAIHDYEEDYRRFPPQAITDKDGKPLLSWRVVLLPYLEDKTLYERFKLDEPWDSAHNQTLLNRMPKVYQHPRSKAKDQGMTFYQVFAGKRTVFEPGQRIGFADIRDGTSNVLLAVEAAEPVPWTKPADLTYHQDKPLPKLGGLFGYGFNALFCDGDVRTIRKDVDENLMRLIIERDDRKAVNLERLSP